jgi:hypothetical protein
MELDGCRQVLARCGGALLCAATGCSGGDDLNAPLSASMNFEEAALGPLAQSRAWTGRQTGASRAEVVEVPDHGRALLVEGSPTSGDYLIYTAELAPLSGEVTLEFDVRPAPGSTPTFLALGAGTTFRSRQLRLFRGPDADALIAGTPSGAVTCEPVRSGVWSHIALRLHLQERPRTFDILINGQPSSRCSGLTTQLKAPITGVGVMDPANDGYGGEVYWDNIVGGAP